MSDNRPYFALASEDEMHKTLYRKANLPDIFWDIEPAPRFQDLTGGKALKQTARDQAQVYNSLLENPKQILEFPRRWRLAAFADTVDRASFVQAKIIKSFIIHGIRVKCCLPSELNKILDAHADVVFVHSCYRDMDKADLMQLRNAHMRPFHLFYAMEGRYEDGVQIIRTNPDYVFNIDEISLNRAVKKVF